MKNTKTELYLYESIDEARGLIQENSLDEAIEKLEKAILVSNQSEDYIAYYCDMSKLIAMCYRKINALDKAEDVLKKALIAIKKRFLKKNELNYFREYAVLLVNLGIILENRGEFYKALEQYNNAEGVFMKLDDGQSLFKIYLTMLNTFIALENIEKAEETLLKAINLAENKNIMYDKQIINEYEKMIKEKKHVSNET